MHTLSVGDCLRFAWDTFKQRPWILIGALLLSMIIAGLPQVFAPHPTVGPDGQIIPAPVSTWGTIVSLVSLLRVDRRQSRPDDVLAARPR